MAVGRATNVRVFIRRRLYLFQSSRYGTVTLGGLMAGMLYCGKQPRRVRWVAGGLPQQTGAV